MYFVVCCCVVRSLGLSMSANVDMIEQTDLDSVFSMQLSQWTIPQFCFRVLENVVRCLRGAADEQLLIQCFELIHQVSLLLADSIVPSLLWEDTGVAAHELVKQLTIILQFTDEKPSNYCKCEINCCFF